MTSVHLGSYNLCVHVKMLKNLHVLIMLYDFFDALLFFQQK